MRNCCNNCNKCRSYTFNHDDYLFYNDELFEEPNNYEKLGPCDCHDVNYDRPCDCKKPCKRKSCCNCNCRCECQRTSCERPCESEKPCECNRPCECDCHRECERQCPREERCEHKCHCECERPSCERPCKCECHRSRCCLRICIPHFPLCR